MGDDEGSKSKVTQDNVQRRNTRSVSKEEAPVVVCWKPCSSWQRVS